MIKNLEENKPCPFCGNSGIVLSELHDGRIQCIYCLAIGPSKNSMENWNSRAEFKSKGSDKK